MNIRTLISTSLTAALVLTLAVMTGCSATSISVEKAQLGKSTNTQALLDSLTQPGPIKFEKHLAANWAVQLSGMVNMDHPKAISAGLEDKLENIELYVYTLTHPKYGTFIVDSGISESLRDPAGNEDISSIIKAAMNMDLLKVKKTTQEINAALDQGIQGVFLTHVHMDHIMGLRDLNQNVPVYIGPGDAALTDFMHLVTQGTTDRLLGNTKSLKEWQFDDQGTIDIFSDGSVWAIHSPGHTPGATAYLANTTNGPELMLGDATHTKWGWNNGVEPGAFSADLPTSAISLQKLVTLVANNPQINVHPGHQSLDK